MAFAAAAVVGARAGAQRARSSSSHSLRSSGSFRASNQSNGLLGSGRAPQFGRSSSLNARGPRPSTVSSATNDGSVVALDYSKDAAAKSWSSSKIRHCWQVMIDGQVHEVLFTNSRTSGKKRVFMDNQLLSEQKVMRANCFRFSWSTGGHMLSIGPDSDGIFGQVDCSFELRIDGRPFEFYITGSVPVSRAPTSPNGARPQVVRPQVVRPVHRRMVEGDDSDDDPELKRALAMSAAEERERQAQQRGMGGTSNRSTQRSTELAREAQRAAARAQQPTSSRVEASQAETPAARGFMQAETPAARGPPRDNQNLSEQVDIEYQMEQLAILASLAERGDPVTGKPKSAESPVDSPKASTKKKMSRGKAVDPWSETANFSSNGFNSGGFSDAWPAPSDAPVWAAPSETGGNSTAVGSPWGSWEALDNHPQSKLADPWAQQSAWTELAGSDESTDAESEESDADNVNRRASTYTFDGSVNDDCSPKTRNSTFDGYDGSVSRDGSFKSRKSTFDGSVNGCASPDLPTRKSLNVRPSDSSPWAPLPPAAMAPTGAQQWGVPVATMTRQPEGETPGATANPWMSLPSAAPVSVPPTEQSNSLMPATHKGGLIDPWASVQSSSSAAPPQPPWPPDPWMSAVSSAPPSITPTAAIQIESFTSSPWPPVQVDATVGQVAAVQWPDSPSTTQASSERMSLSPWGAVPALSPTDWAATVAPAAPAAFPVNQASSAAWPPPAASPNPWS